jgi:RHS repeat-associated protein
MLHKSIFSWATVLVLMVGVALTPAIGDPPPPEGPVPVSTTAATIGGEKFSVDPRMGTLDYNFEFFNGNVNYGQTPFILALTYQATAAGSYVGEFKSSSEPLPYGVSAYLPSPLPKSQYQSKYDDSGAVWDLNLPAVFIGTGKLSKFYGSDLISATLVLNNSNSTYVMNRPSISNTPTSNTSDYVPQYTANLISASKGVVTGGNTGALYNQDAQFMSFSAYGSDGKGFQIQDKQGVHYIFKFAVLQGIQGINIYDPDYNPYVNEGTTAANEVLVYRIQSIIYPSGQSLNFAYQDDFIGNSSHKVTITDTKNNTVAIVSTSGKTSTVSVANQQGQVPILYTVNLDGFYRVSSIVNQLTSRSLSFAYNTYTGVPYSWNDQTTLVSISNNYTGMNTTINYANQFNAKAYDGGCNSFYLGQLAVSSVTNLHGSTTLSAASYDYGFSHPSESNFVIPQASDKKTYGAGLSHWLDNVFYPAMNQDSNNCSNSDMVDPATTSYGTTITTTYGGNALGPRNSQQIMTYDALGRLISTTINKWADVGLYTEVIGINYTYPVSINEIRSNYSNFGKLPLSYAQPASKTTVINTCWMNGVPQMPNSLPNTCYPSRTQTWTYDAQGNPTKTVSLIGQETDYTYWPAASTSPPYEYLPYVTTTYGLGSTSQSGGPYIQQTQNYQNIALAPSSGAISTTTLPTTASEVHLDALGGSPYTVTNNTLSYFSNNANSLLNGLVSQNQTADGTGASDVSSTTMAITNPQMVSSGGQNLLTLNFRVSGQANAGTSAMTAGSSLLNYMGYLVQTSNALNQATVQTYDNYARIVASVTMKGTAYAQTTKYTYDDALNLCVSPCTGAKFSISTIDPFGNKTIKLYDYQLRPLATYQQLVGSSSPLLMEVFTIDDVRNVITSATRYGRCDTGCNGNPTSAMTVNYYYMQGTSEPVAGVPSVGLAQGKIIDAVNANTLVFNYVPASTSNPTQIQKIVGGVSITRQDLFSGVSLYQGIISAEAATAALQGLDFVNLSSTAPMIPATGLNIWLSPANLSPTVLLPLYQAIGQHAPAALTPTDNLLSVNQYHYDEWNRQIGVDNYTFPNRTLTDNAGGSPTMQKNTTLLSYDDAHRAQTVTYPQGQQKTSVFNLLSGLQSANLTVNGNATALGNFQHDGLGRVIQFNDTLNGANGKATWTYDANTGLLTGGTDIVGNTMGLLYNSPLYQPIQTSITPATSGPSIVVSKAYDKFGRVTTVSDSKGNTYTKTYLANGLPGSTSVRYGGQSTSYKKSFSYDAYGLLSSLSDPFLPVGPASSPPCPPDQLIPNSPYGYTIGMDNYGRVGQIAAQRFHGVTLQYSYDNATNKVTQTNLTKLPGLLFGVCGTETVGVTSSYGYDNYLRAISKTIQPFSISQTNVTAQFNQTFDLAGRVVSTTRQDAAGTALNEYYAYDPVTGDLLNYKNNSGTATPYGYLSGDGPLGYENYSYDLYGNLTQLASLSPAGSPVMTRTYAYNASNPFRLNGITETRPNGTFSGQYTYDVAGNVTRDAYGRQFSYNPQGLVSSIQLSNGSKEAFTYDGLGRLIQKQYGSASPILLYGSAQVTNQQWQVQYLGGSLSFQNAGGYAGSNYRGIIHLADLGGKPVNSLSYGQNMYAFNVLSNSSYTPFGVMTDLMNQSAGYPAALSNQTNYPEGAWGEVQGREVTSGLSMLGGYRAYDPVIGRFLQMDSLSPFGAGGLNGYEYASNNPVSFFDPTGHYKKVKAHRYGPKPPSVHRESGGCGAGGGVLGGFVSGMCNTFMMIKESIVTTAKNDSAMIDDLAHGNFKGYGRLLKKTDEDTIKSFVNSVKYYFNNPGGPMMTLMFEEMNLKPTNAIQGKSPYHKYHVSSYEAGYVIGSTLTADAIEAAVIWVAGEAAAAFEAAELEADSEVMNQAGQSGVNNMPSADNGALDNGNVDPAVEENGSEADSSEDNASVSDASSESNGDEENGNGNNPANQGSHPHSWMRKALAKTYGFMHDLIEYGDKAHSIYSLIEQGSNYYEEQNSTEDSGNAAIRVGFGQIKLGTSYKGIRIDDYSPTPNFTGTNLFGAYSNGNALLPPALKTAPAQSPSNSSVPSQ